MKKVILVISCFFLFYPLFPTMVGARDCAEIRKDLSTQKAKVNKLKAELKDAGFFSKGKLQKELKAASKDMTRFQKEWLIGKCGKAKQPKTEPSKRPAPEPKKLKESTPKQNIPKDKPLGEPV